MKRIERDIWELLQRGEELVLATILTHLGSTPRSVGARMVIRPDGRIRGTIGGGKVEGDVIEAAKEVRANAAPTIRSYDLTGTEGADMDLICGGRLSVLMEYLAPEPDVVRRYGTVLEAAAAGQRLLDVVLLPETVPSAPLQRFVLVLDGSLVGAGQLPADDAAHIEKAFAKRRPAGIVERAGRRYLVEPLCGGGTVFLFGAGHVSLQVARLTSGLDFRTVVLDDRREFANESRFTEADEVRVLADFDSALQGLPVGPDSYLVIVTRGHSHDKTVLAQALRTAAGYIGMIGSRRKRDTIYKALLGEGFSREDLERVHCPIGLKIGAETPEEIAVSIVAELIQARAGRD